MNFFPYFSHTQVSVIAVNLQSFSLDGLLCCYPWCSIDRAYDDCALLPGKSITLHNDGSFVHTTVIWLIFQLLMQRHIRIMCLWCTLRICMNLDQCFLSFFFFAALHSAVYITEWVSVLFLQSSSPSFLMNCRIWNRYFTSIAASIDCKYCVLSMWVVDTMCHTMHHKWNKNSWCVYMTRDKHGDKMICS